MSFTLFAITALQLTNNVYILSDVQASQVCFHHSTYPFTTLTSCYSLNPIQTSGAIVAYRAESGQTLRGPGVVPPSVWPITTELLDGVWALWRNHRTAGHS